MKIKYFQNIKDEYVAISHRQLDNGLVALGKDINIGEKIYDHLYEKRKCSTVLNKIQTQIQEKVEKNRI